MSCDVDLSELTAKFNEIRRKRASGEKRLPTTRSTFSVEIKLLTSVDYFKEILSELTVKFHLKTENGRVVRRGFLPPVVAEIELLTSVDFLEGIFKLVSCDDDLSELTLKFH